MPDDDLTRKNCVKCSVSNCEICKGNINNNICVLCEQNYYLVNNECKPYSFMATYHNDNKNEEIKVINENYISSIIGMYMNNSEIHTSYNFSIGNHTIYFDMNISSLE